MIPGIFCPFHLRRQRLRISYELISALIVFMMLIVRQMTPVPAL